MRFKELESRRWGFLFSFFCIVPAPLNEKYWALWINIKAKKIAEKKKSIQSDTLENAYKDKHFSLNLSHILFLMHQSSAIVPSFHIAADAWNQLPADIRTSSSLLKFKDSTRHYTSPGRQLSLRHNCCCFMFPDSLSRAAQLHVPFEASLHLSDSNFNSSEQKNREDSSFLSVFNRAQWETGERKRGVGGGHNHSPVEMSCSCDQCPSKVRLQRCIFSSDGSQDRQIMRSQPSQLQRMFGVFGQCLGPYESFSLLTAVLPNTAHSDSPLVTKNNTQSGKRNNAA